MLFILIVILGAGVIATLTIEGDHSNESYTSQHTRRVDYRELSDAEIDRLLG